MSWLLTILGIVLLIVLHELGHFAAAKAVGMRVERFSLFFPPNLFSFRRGETEYAVGAIPAGGYVKITGMNPEELGDLDPEAARRAYYAQDPWKRVVVILAGPAVNIVIAFLLFWGVLLSGSLDGSIALTNVDPGLKAVTATTAVRATSRGTPAYGVLQAGDRIVAVEGRPATVSSAQQTISAHRCAGPPTDGCRAVTPVKITVKRAGRELTLAVFPRYSQVVKRMLVGFEFGLKSKAVAPLPAAGAAVGAMWGTTTNLLAGIGHAFTSEKARHELHSIVGITEAAHEDVAAGAGLALVFLGFLSLVLAVINLFPFLPLDGGHILWSVAEKVRGRRISLMAMYRYSSVGIVLLLFLVLNGFSNDISHLAG
jgi:regulator of sigma E protease